MWTILKFNKKKLSILKEDLKKKLGKNFKIYIPKLRIEIYKNNKLIKKDFNLLDDYMFFFHENICFDNKINKIKFSRGLKYYLKDFKQSQNDIVTFIQKCKKSENKEGYLTNNFFELDIKKEYKFSSGPFTNKIFQILNFNKNKINILMGNIKTTLSKKEHLFSPI